MSGRGRALVALAAAAMAAAALLALRQIVVGRDPLDRLARAPAGAGTVYAGSWYFPRGGPYVLGFDAPVRRNPGRQDVTGGDARLEVDGRLVAAGRGLVSERVLFEAGAHAIRFMAPPGARLLWHPPGRRGPLEYVPPSSLDREPPERAAFGAWAGASPGDGFIALALFAVAAALVLFLARASARRIDGQVLVWAGLVFACALGVRLIDLGGAGQTWDEDVNWSAGRNYVTNWLALDFRESSWQWNFEHPPMTKYAAGLAALWSDSYGPARAVSAGLVAAACALLVAVGRRLYSLRVGVLAGLVAALSPHLVAHGKIVGHEAMAVFLWTAAVLAALGAHDRVEQLPERDVRRHLALRFATVGALLGAAVSSRLVNVLLAPLLGALLLLEARPGSRRRALLLGLTVLPAVATLVCVVSWPRLWSSPLLHLAESWHKLRGLHGEELFLGQITTRPPALAYFPVYLVATAPVGVLAGAALWMVRCGVRRERGSLIVALWLAVPLLAFLSPVRQDGVRYIMPSLVALALAGAAGIDGLISWLGQKIGPSRERPLFAAASAALLVYLAIVCWRIHPYYLDYYGEQFGGPAAVARDRRFEVAWWGEGIAEAVDAINRRAAPGARVHRGCVRPSHLTWLRSDLWRNEARRPADADWILVYEPSWRRCPLPADARLVHEVTAQGAPLARVYARAGAAGAATPPAGLQ